jgi:hypothetical protein
MSECISGELDKVNAITQKILETIVNRIRNPKYCIFYEGQNWTVVKRDYFAKPHLCSTKTVTVHTNLLEKMGLIKKGKILKEDGISTNGYTINLEILSRLGEFKGFFSPYLLTKIRNYIISTPSLNKSSIPPLQKNMDFMKQTEEAEDFLFRLRRYEMCR